MTSQLKVDRISSATDTALTITDDLKADSLYVGGYESNWVDFTPTFSFFTAGNETKYGKYIRFKDFILIKVYLVIGSTTVVSDGFSLDSPFPFGITFEFNAGTALAKDVSSANDYNGIVQAKPQNGGDMTSTRLRPTFYTSFNTARSAQSNVPFTWDTGDILSLEMTGVVI